MASGTEWAATPRRFVMVSTFYPPYSFGGDATYLHRLVNALAEDGHSVEVVHDVDSYKLLAKREPAPGWPNHPRVKVTSLRSPAGPLSPLATQQTGIPFFKRGVLQRALVDAKPDVIHFHNMSLAGGPGALSIGSAIKLYTTHEHWLVCPMHVLWRNNSEPCETPTCWSCQIKGGRPPQWWRATPLLDRSLDHIDRFLAPSRFTMQKHLSRGLAGRPFENLPYFVPSPGALEPREAQERPYFLFVGRLERIKGVHNLIEAMRGFPAADLVIAGDGLEENALKAQAAGLPSVRFAGRLDQASLRRLYRNAVALIVPSICYEVFGIVILEAFATATPAIVNDLGALPEVIADSDGGFTYRSQDELVAAMTRLLENSAERDHLGQNGYNALVKRWTTRPHLTQYYDICAEIQEGREAI